MVNFNVESVLCKRERQTEKERCAWAGNKQTFFFFQYSRKSNSNIFALMVLLATTVVIHSTSHTLSMTHTHTHTERNKDRDILNSPQFEQSTMKYTKTNKYINKTWFYYRTNSHTDTQFQKIDVTK